MGMFYDLSRKPGDILREQVNMEKTADYTVYIVDDDRDLLDLIALYVESAGYHAQACTSAEEFLAGYDPLQPGVLLLDIYMHGMSGLELQQELNERDVQLPIIIMTAQGDVTTAVQAMKAGAVDYIEKPLEREQLLERIQDCVELDENRRDKEARHDKYGQYLRELSSREYEVMEHMVAGQMNKVIAAELEISQRTVEDHRAKVMEKLHAKSLADVVRIYLLSQY